MAKYDPIEEFRLLIRDGASPSLSASAFQWQPTNNQKAVDDYRKLVSNAWNDYESREVYDNAGRIRVQQGYNRAQEFANQYEGILNMGQNFYQPSNAYAELLKQAQAGWDTANTSKDFFNKTGFSDRQAYEQNDELSKYYKSIIESAKSQQEYYGQFDHISDWHKAQMQTMPEMRGPMNADVWQEWLRTPGGQAEIYGQLRREEEKPGDPGALQLPEGSRNAAGGGAIDVSYADFLKEKPGQGYISDAVKHPGWLGVPMNVGTDSDGSILKPLIDAERQLMQARLEALSPGIRNLKRFQGLKDLVHVPGMDKYAMTSMTPEAMKSALGVERELLTTGKGNPILVKNMEEYYFNNTSAGTREYADRLKAQENELFDKILSIEDEIELNNNNIIINSWASYDAAAEFDDADVQASIDRTAELEASLPALRQELQRVQGMQNLLPLQEKYLRLVEENRQLREDPDFLAKTFFQPDKGFGSSTSADTGRYIYNYLAGKDEGGNSNHNVRQAWFDSSQSVNAQMYGLDKLLTEEKQTFMYKYNVEGAASALSYLEELGDVLLYRRATENDESWRAYASKNGWTATLATLESVPLNMINAALTPVRAIHTLAGSSPFAPIWDAQRRVDTSRAVGGQMMGEWMDFNIPIIDKNAGELIYGVGTSMADMWAAAGISSALGSQGLVSVILGSSAASASMRNALLTGKNPLQATAQGLAAGVIEHLTEQIAWNRLTSLSYSAQRSLLKNVATNIGLQAATEGAEEGIANIANLALSWVMYGLEGSDIGDVMEQVRKDAIIAGESLSDQDVTTRAMLRLLQNFGGDVLAGMLSGGLNGAAMMALPTQQRNELIDRYRSDKEQYGGEKMSPADSVIPLSKLFPPSEKPAQQQAQLDAEADIAPRRAPERPVDPASEAIAMPPVQETREERMAKVQDISQYAEDNAETLSPQEKRQIAQQMSDWLSDVDNLPTQAQVQEQLAKAAQMDAEAADGQADKPAAPTVPNRPPAAVEQDDSPKSLIQRRADAQENLYEIIRQGVVGEQLAWAAEMDQRIADLNQLSDEQVAGPEIAQEIATIEAEIQQRMPEQPAKSFYRYKKVMDAGGMEIREQHREASELPAEEYDLGFDLAYEAGRSGYGEAFLEFSPSVKALPVEARNAAYEAGKAAAPERLEAQKESADVLLRSMPIRGKGRVTFRDSWNKKDGTTAEQRDFARLLSNYGKVMGFDIEVYKSVADDQGLLQGENGSFDQATGKLVFDINAGAMTVQEVAKASLPVTMAHELTHYLKTVMPVEFRQFQQMVLNRMAERGTDIDALLKRQMDLARNALDMDTLMEEVIANASSMMLQDSTAMNQIAEQNPGLFAKLMDWLSDFIQRIKTNLSKLDATMPGAEALLEMKDGVLRVAEQYQQTWDKMMVGADSKRAALEKQRTAKPAVAAKGQGIQAVADADGQVVTPAQEPVKVAQNAPAALNRGTVFTADNQEIGFEYKLVPIDDLIVSNNADMSVNAAYPAELQPRDRARVASRDQVEGIARDLNPVRLGESIEVSKGAPIVGPDLVVEAGNGRVMALRLAQERFKGNAAAYTKWLRANAAAYGLDPRAVTAESVLVRMRDNAEGFDRVAFTQKSNESGVAAYSETENAIMDAAKITPAILAAAEIRGGELNTDGNSPFIRRFIDRVIPASERGSFIDSKGDVSQRGLARIRNALFQRAYNSQSLTDQLAEVTDADAKNVIKAMTNVAPRIALMADDIAKGRLHDVLPVAEIIKAYETYTTLKANQQNVNDWLGQLEFIDRHIPTDYLLVRMFEENKAAPSRMTDAFNSILDMVEKYGRPDQTMLPGLETARPNAEAIIREGIEKFNDERLAASERKLFSERDSDNNPLSPEQIEYFKDSKVRDEQGRLLVVYHGVKSPNMEIAPGEVLFSAPFSEFDVSKESPGKIEPGAWFSPDKSVARLYGTPVPYYLNAKTPIQDESPISKKPKEHDAVYRMRSSREGIHNAWEIAVFSPEQIKEVTNLTPTSSPDIRYQERDSDNAPLSPEQIEYFKDSKVRDGQGRLLKVYHGSPNEFSTFSRKYLGSNTGRLDNGAGFYFSSGKTGMLDGAASWYGDNITEAYLDIKNPLVLTDASSIDLLKIVAQLNPDKKLDGYTLSEILNVYNDVISREFDVYDGTRANSKDIQVKYDGRSYTLRNYTGNIESNREEIAKYFTSSILGVSIPIRLGEYGLHSEVMANYDGVINGNEYVAFSPEQIKSVDNQNPTTDPDIRYSARDTQYLVAVESGDMDTAQKMVDEAAKAAGYTIKAYHGTSHEFYEFDKGKQGNNYNGWGVWGKAFYFSGESRAAWNHAYKNAGFKDAPKVVNSYLKITNPYYKNGLETIDAAELEKQGYDGIVSYYFNQAGDFAVFSPDQVKLADPVTYDDAGNPIPLSERFKDSSPDIRYQERNLFDDGTPTPRGILAGVFGEVAKTDGEKKQVASYKKQVALFDRIDTMLIDKRAELRELNKARAPKEQRALVQEEIAELTAKLDKADRILLNLQNSKPLQDIVKRERTKVEAVAKAKMDERIAKEKERNQEYKDRLRQEYKDKAAKLKADNKEYREEVKERYQDKFENWKDKEKDKVEQRESRKKHRESIKKITKDLTEWTTSPTGKKHVPEVLRSAIGEFMLSVNEQSRRAAIGGADTIEDRRFYDRLDALNKALQRVQKQQNTDAGEFVDDVYEGVSGHLDLPAEFTDSLSEMVTQVKALVDSNAGEHVLALMNNEQLQALDEALTALYHAVRQMNDLIANRVFKKANELGQYTINDISGMKSRLEKKGQIHRFLNWENIEPVYAFEQFGKGGQSIMQGMIDGMDRQAKNAHEVVVFAENTFSENESREWSKQLHTFQIEGKQVKMTTAHLMSLWALMNREKARDHILGGGIRVADFKIGRTNYADSGHVLLPADVYDMLSVLTPRQIEVARALQQFMSTRGSEWGNAVSMARFGVKLFGEEYYFPIQSVRENIDEKMDSPEGNPLYRLLNLSMTKGLTEGANNQIVLGNIIDVFASHMSDMAQYNALALPILDAVKWYNYRESYKEQDTGRKRVTSVRGTLRNAFGDQGINYVYRLLSDINGSRMTGGGENFAMNRLRLYNRSVVAANLRVALLQPTSIIRAHNVIDARYLSAGLLKNIPKMKANITEMETHSGIAVWKQMGFWDVNISRSLQEMIKRDNPLLDRMTEKSMALPQMMDRITWAAIWEGAKGQIAAENPGLNKTSQEYFDKVRDLFDQAIYKTQVVDTMLTRSEFMRRPSGVAKTFSSFMSEPTKTYNILASQYHAFNNDLARGMNIGEAWKKNGRKIARTATTYALSALLVTMVEALAGAWRDDDEYTTFMEKMRKSFSSNLLDNLMPLNLPIVSDLWQMAKRYVGQAFKVDLWGYQDTNPFFAAFELIGDGVVGVMGQINGTNKKTTPYGVGYKLLQGLSALTGHPFASATRETIDFWNNTVGKMYPEYRVVRYKPGQATGFEALFKALQADDNERSAEIREILERQGVDDKKVYGGLRDQAREAYKEGNLTFEGALKMLEEQEGSPDKGLYWTVKEWEARREADDWSTEFKYSRYDAYHEAIQTGTNLKQLTQELIDNYGGDAAKARSTISGEITSYWKERYVELYKNSKAQASNLKARLMNAYALLGYDRAKKGKDIDAWLKDK